MTPCTVCFPLPLRVEIVSFEPRIFRLLSDFPFNGKGYSVTVPEGTETDLASIPRAFHSLLSPFGPYGFAAVVHDYLYRTGAVSRAVADAVFLEGMARSHVPLWQRLAIYVSVRLFGWLSYEEDEECLL